MIDLDKHWANVDRITKIIESLPEGLMIENPVIRQKWYWRWICWFHHPWIRFVAKHDPRICLRCGRFEYLKP